MATTIRNGVHESLLPSRIKRGAMSTHITNGREIGHVAKIARDPSEVVTITPLTDFFIGWMDQTEEFFRGVKREVTIELRDHLIATGHPIS